MYKTALRAAPRYTQPSRNLLSKGPARRFLTTAPPAQKRRGWTNTAVRLGLAGGVVYLYSTSNVFAEEPEVAIRQLDDSIHAVQESNQPTIDAIVEEKRRREAQQAAEEQEKERVAKAALAEDKPGGAEEGEEGMGGLEQEADSQGAFNPETGEINWDCPCLGGMAHGPCGEEFRAAFSCFVYSNEEPKGVECIEKFKGMQDCFRLHPEMYGSELEDDEDEVEEELRAREAATSADEEKTPSTPSTESSPSAASSTAEPSKLEGVSKEIQKESQRKEAEITGKSDKDQRANDAEASTDAQASSDKDDELIPKAAHNATRK